MWMRYTPSIKLIKEELNAVVKMYTMSKKNSNKADSNGTNISIPPKLTYGLVEIRRRKGDTRNANINLGSVVKCIVLCVRSPILFSNKEVFV